MTADTAGAAGTAGHRGTARPPVPRRVAPPSLFPDRWPGAAGPAPVDVLLAALIVGLAAATAVPAGPTGVGWLYTLTVAAATTIMVRWRANRTGRFVPSRPLLAPDVGWTLLALALSAVGTVRAAEWLAALCLLATVAAAALALAGPSFPALPASLTVPVAAAVRAVPWVWRGLHAEGRPSWGRALGVGLASGAVLLVFVPLLASADAAFSAVVAQFTPTVEVDSVTRWVVLLGLGAAGTAGACFLLLAPPEPVERVLRPTRLRCLDWALPTGLLVAVFALFVGVQFVVLFGSDDHVLGTAGLTYAEYARSGFWQLLAVTALALGVLAFDSRWAPVATPAERATKRGLLAALAVLTLVVVASAIHRMWLYQQAYGFTVLRLVVLTCELWLGAGFVLALVAVVRLRPAGLSRSMVAAGMLALLGLAVLDPERFVAEHNVARWVETGRLDTSYLSTLSADAVPVLDALPAPLRDCTLAGVAARLAEPDDWRSANLSRAAARDILGGVVPPCAEPRALRPLLEPQRQPRHQQQDLVADRCQRGVERAQLVAEQPARARRRHDPQPDLRRHQHGPPPAPGHGVDQLRHPRTDGVGHLRPVPGAGVVEDAGQPGREVVDEQRRVLPADGAQQRGQVGVLDGGPAGGPPGPVRVDPGRPLGVVGVPARRRGVAHRRVGRQQVLGVARLARARAAEDEAPPTDEGRYGFAPRSTRGLGMRIRRGWVARVNAYQPVPRPLTCSSGNFSRAFLVRVSPGRCPRRPSPPAAPG